MYYLMIKEIEQTGMKYLCKKKQNLRDINDHINYKGSGKFWNRILRAHPDYTIKTTVLGLFTAQELEKQGLYYSKFYNIVESKEWANLIPESGVGGDTSKTENFLKAQKEGRLGTKQLPTKYIFNPIINIAKKIPINDTVPEGWTLGNDPKKKNGPNIGAKIYHNGERKIYLYPGETIPNGFIPGLWYKGTTKNRIGCYNPNTMEKKYVTNIEEIPTNWVRGVPPTTNKKIQTPDKIYCSIKDCMEDLHLTRYQISKNINTLKGWNYI